MLTVCRTNDDVVYKKEVCVIDRGRQARPGYTCVCGLEDAGSANTVGVEESLACARVENVSIRRINRHAGNGDVCEKVVEGRPGGAAVRGFPDSACNCRGVHDGRIDGIDDQSACTTADVAWSSGLP